MSDLVWRQDTAQLGSLELWEDNPKWMSKNAAERLLAGWKKTGQFQTLAVGPGGECYDGHQRIKTLIAAGYPADYELFVLRSDRPLTDEERREIILHSTMDVGTFDWSEIANWESAGWLDGFGFDSTTLAEWNESAASLKLMLEAEKEPLPESSEPQIDKAEELRELYGCELGQIWQLGEHFVICGDCRESETWARLLAAAGIEKVNGVFTSPPYAMQREKQYGGVPTAEYVEWWGDVQANVRANLADDGSFFVNIKPHCEDGQRVLYVFDLVLAMVRRWGWRFVEEFVWKKPGIPPSFNEKQFRDRWEPVFLFSVSKNYKIDRTRVAIDSDSVIVKGSYSQRNNAGSGKELFRAETEHGKAIASNIIEAAGSAGGHAAAFPVALPTFFIKAYSDKGDVWLDPFCGSGTTIVAAHQNGRRGLGIELLPKYVGLIIQRWVDMTGGKPILLPDLK